MEECGRCSRPGHLACSSLRCCIAFTSQQKQEIQSSLVDKAGIKKLLCEEEMPLLLVVEGMTQQSCKSKPGSTRCLQALEQKRKGEFPVASYGQGGGE